MNLVKKHGNTNYMSRPLRIEFPGAIYHILARGNEKQAIFKDDDDSALFLSILDEVCHRYQWICYAYCLMGNHYHILIETVEANLSLGMQLLNGKYTQKINYNHGRVGHLFQGRYKAILVEKQTYLLELFRYIVLNPVRAGLVRKPEWYPWSSYPATTGKTAPLPFLNASLLLEQFSANHNQAIQLLEKFVLEAKGKDSPMINMKENSFLGNKEFIATVMKHSQGRRRYKEIPRKERFAGRPDLISIFEKTANRKERNEAIYIAHIKHGYKLVEISRHLKRHYSTISKAFRQYCREKEALKQIKKQTKLPNSRPDPIAKFKT